MVYFPFSPFFEKRKKKEKALWMTKKASAMD